MKIKIILTILASSIIFLGCKEAELSNHEHKLILKTEKRIHNIHKGDYEVLVIERCQYILYQEREGTNRGYGYMAHKGNCNNPKHSYKEFGPIYETLKEEGSNDQN